jgi:hypothetical protein
MRHAMLLLIGSAAALALVSAWPRAGHPVLVILPPGAAVGPAFVAEGWRILRVTQAGPVAVLVAAPDTASAQPGVLRRAAGAVLAIAARPTGDCAPAPARGA